MGDATEYPFAENGIWLSGPLEPLKSRLVCKIRMTDREGRNYDGIDLKSKTAGYFTSTMGFIGKSGGIAIQDKQALTKAIGKSREQRGGT